MNVHYYKDVIDPTDMEVVHVVYTDDRDGFEKWLTENAPSHRWSNSGQRAPVLRPYYGAKAWGFFVKLSSEDHAKLAALWPEKHGQGPQFDGIEV